MEINTTEYKKIVFIEAKPELGFNFGYFLILNRFDDSNKKLQMIGEANNTRITNDTAENFERCKFQVFKNGLLFKHMAGFYNNSAVVYPTFLRPPLENKGDLDTHALTSMALHSTREDIKRVDLQFLAMFQHAKEVLRTWGYEPTEKLIMTGFSASAKFAQRFAFLHPEQVSAVVAGGMSATLCLPVESYKGYTLNYPLGTNDYEEITGRKFDKEAFDKIPHYVLMGDQDQNDPVPYHDCFTDEEREAIIGISDADIQKRWFKMLEIIKDLRLNVYPFLNKGYDHTPKGMPKILEENLPQIKQQIEENNKNI